MLLAAGGWLIIIWMVYIMSVTARTAPKVYDPFAILGIKMSASEKEIKSHYRRLSLTQHPDKVKLDPAKNETVESANEHWVEITKAFKTLTDEEVRNNFLQYGHPDGKQSFSIGIALPKFIIEEGSGKWVLALYGSLLGVVLPWLVGRWWYNNQRLSKEKVLVTSAGKLFKAYDDSISEGGVIAALANGDEYNDLMKGKTTSGMARVEQKVAGLLPGKELARLQEMPDEVRRYVLSLLWAYLGRVDLGDAAMNDGTSITGKHDPATNIRCRKVRSSSDCPRSK